MKTRLPLMLLASVLFFGLTSKAQEYNIIKTNLTSLLTGNYSLQYERAFTETVSASVTFSMMPKKGIPFQGLISDAVETNQDIDFDLNSFKFSSWSIVPDVRFYLGEGYGKGFYIAPYFKHSQFKIHDFNIEYTDTENNQNQITLSGNFKTNAGGVMFGSQFFLGDYVCLDWWILGFHAGRATTSIVGDPLNDLSPANQQDLKDTFADIDVPMMDFEPSVSADRVSITTKMPWVSVRAGLSIGVRF